MMFVNLRLTAFLLLFVSVVVGKACNFSSHPTDNEMEELLKSNQSDLETLVTMLAEDQDIIVLDDKFVFFIEGSYRVIPGRETQSLQEPLCKTPVGARISAR